jgi:hypothetical protein
MGLALSIADLRPFGPFCNIGETFIKFRLVC